MREPLPQNYRIAGRIPVPAGLYLQSSEQRFRQGIALTVCLLSVSVFMVLFTAGFQLLSFTMDFDLPKEEAALFLITVGILAQLAGFYRYANIRVSAMLLTMTYFFMTIAVVVFSGGYESPLSPLLLCAVVVSFRFGNREDGFMSALYVTIAILALVGAYSFEIPSANILKGLPQPILFGIGWFSTLLTIVACLGTYTYDRNN